MHPPQTDRASHCQIVFSCTLNLLQMSYKGIGWTPGIIILISLISSYIQNSITTKRHWFWMIRRCAKCCAEGLNEIINQIFNLHRYIFHSKALVLTNSGTVRECLFSSMENKVFPRHNTETQMEGVDQHSSRMKLIHGHILEISLWWMHMKSKLQHTV